MQKKIIRCSTAVLFLFTVCFVGSSIAQNNPGSQQQRSRRSQRVRMERVEVSSPSGNLKLTLLPNAERLTYTVTMGGVTVIEPSSIIMDLDGYDLSSGVVYEGIENFKIDETYPWYG